MSSVVVGNDVVDLTNPRTERYATNDRFLGRVFAEAERQVIQTSAEPDLELWAHWAAKEAGFKVISKLIGEPPPFVHKAFGVEWGSAHELAAEEDEAVIRRGRVRYGEYEAPVSVAFRPGGVHAVAFATRGRVEHVQLRPRVALLHSSDSRWSGSLGELLPRLTEREANGVHSVESAAVRLGARGDLADMLRVSEERVEIVCALGTTGRGPPLVLLDGNETEADVSLSHDGRWIAWAVWVGIAGATAP